MKKALIVMMVMMMAVGAMAEGVTAEVTLDAASAYVFRGSTFNDGFVLQPGAEVAIGDLSVGTWANYDVDDYDGALDDNEFSEVDIFGSYSLPVESVGLSVGYCAYIYPLDSTDADHEVSVSAELDMLLAPSVSVNYGLDGGIEDAIYIELGIGHEFSLCENVDAELGLAIGYLEPDEGDSGFTHADISAGLSYKDVSATVTYVAQIDDDILPDFKDGGAYDTELYASLGVKVGF